MQIIIRKIGTYVEIKVKIENAVFDLGLFDEEEARAFHDVLQGAASTLKETFDF